MHISNFDYKIVQLTPDLIKQSAKILANMFVNENKVWSTLKPDLMEAQKFMEAKIAQMLKWEQELRDDGIIGKRSFINFVYMNRKDEIVAVWTNYELTQFLNKKNTIKLAAFDALEKYSEQLNRYIDPQQLVPGLNLNGMFCTMKKQYNRMPEVKLFLIDGTEWLYSQGFRNIMGRCSSYGAYLAVKSQGAEITKTIQADINGQKLDLFYVKWPIIPYFKRRQQQLISLRANL